jgi:hypothetical protein
MPLRWVRAVGAAACAAAALAAGPASDALGQDRMRSMTTFQDPSGRMKIDMPGKPLVRGASKEPGLVAMAWETDVDDDRSLRHARLGRVLRGPGPGHGEGVPRRVA